MPAQPEKEIRAAGARARRAIAKARPARRNSREKPAVKKLIPGIAVMTLGSLGAMALLFGTFVAKPAVYNGVSGWLGCFLDRGLLGPFTVFVAAALLGLTLALWGVFEKED